MATSAFISKPDVTLNMLARGGETGVEDHRILMVGQLTTAGTASAGLFQDVPRNNADINAAFGPRSHAAMIARAVRKVNKYTEMDALLLADATGTAATASGILLGTATAAGTIYLDVVSSTDHSYKVDIEVGDDEAAVMVKILAKTSVDTSAPFTGAKSTVTNTDDTITFTAANDGTFANKWLIRLRGTMPAGITFTLTGWASGATDPTITSVFDPVANIRYQTIIWPGTYTTSILQTWIDARKNVDNDIKDGVAFYWTDDTFSNVKTEALARNTSEIVILHNETQSTATYKGPHIPEAPDVIAAQFAATRAKRFEASVSITDIVTSIEPLDQFGGIHTAALPYFNTLLPYLEQPVRGTGLTQAEQAELRGAGVSVIGANELNNGILAGTVVTTYQNDGAGNDDDSWQFLNWRDTHSIVREYFHANIKAHFAQYRMSTGEAVPGYAIATEGLVRAYAVKLYTQLAAKAITVDSRDALKSFREDMIVTAVPSLRKFDCYFDVPVLSQAEKFLGSVRFNFGITTS
tara:strand:+ start:4091 stop:5659 length:1569 start_codon:yes stop_codon:yes gene_type:complete